MIPVYGVEPWLAECLDSVLAQTLTEIEVLCVDDASPDRCGEILDEYAARDSRMRVFHLKENRRQGYGRNLGMDHARGTYIYLLDSDDRIRPEALERLYALAEADSLDGIFFDTEVFYENERLARTVTIYHPVSGDHYEDRVQRG
ncbi:MAG: glycosyltransferase family 2 protein, partial [Lachnospiraceae bacterium]|nr:glycosyltransferase family 2 protein [Lachnospiraceae bacterium]